MSGGGVGSDVGGVVIRDAGVRRRLVIRLNGFSSTLSRRDVCRESNDSEQCVFYAAKCTYPHLPGRADRTHSWPSLGLVLCDYAISETLTKVDQP